MRGQEEDEGVVVEEQTVAIHERGEEGRRRRRRGRRRGRAWEEGRAVPVWEASVLEEVRQEQ